MATGNAVQDLLAKASKKYNIVAGKMSDIAEDVSFISTGNISIDYAIGGGIPIGRSVEFFGPPSCGKTTTAFQTVASLQKIIKNGGDETLGIAADDYILYADYEQAIDPEYIKSLGIDIEHESLIFTQPDSLEDGANFIVEMVGTGKVRLVVIDSVAAMQPDAKAEAEIGKSLPAVMAKLLKDFGVKMNPILSRNNCSMILINHMMEKMDMGARRPGMPPITTTPGGSAPKFFASVRAEFRQVKQNKEEVLDLLTRETVREVTSSDVRVKVVKNKVAPPFKEVVVRVRRGKGFDNFWSALSILIANKWITYSAGYYYMPKLEAKNLVPDWVQRATTGTKRPYVKGEAAIFKAADAHPEWRAGLIALAQEVISSGGAVAQGLPEESEEAESAPPLSVESLIPVEEKPNTRKF